MHHQPANELVVSRNCLSGNANDAGPLPCVHELE
jgi:hypothetical protein